VFLCVCLSVSLKDDEFLRSVRVYFFEDFLQTRQYRSLEVRTTRQGGAAHTSSPPPPPHVLVLLLMVVVAGAVLSPWRLVMVCGDQHSAVVLTIVWLCFGMSWYQVILRAKYDTSAYMWSLACITFELLTGNLLFDLKTGELKHIQELKPWGLKVPCDKYSFSDTEAGQIADFLIPLLDFNPQVGWGAVERWWA